MRGGVIGCCRGTPSSQEKLSHALLPTFINKRHHISSVHSRASLCKVFAELYFLLFCSRFWFFTGRLSVVIHSFRPFDSQYQFYQRLRLFVIGPNPGLVLNKSIFKVLVVFLEFCSISRMHLHQTCVAHSSGPARRTVFSLSAVRLNFWRRNWKVLQYPTTTRV